MKRFNGGQLEVQNRIKKYLFRGEIKDVRIEEGNLIVKLNWNAIGEGFPPLPRKWVKDTDSSRLNYNASMSIYQIVDVSDKRLVLASPILNELTVFYSKDGSRLNPLEVEGLVLE